MSYIYGAPILDVSRSHTTTQHSRDSSGRVISLSQRPLPDNTRHSQQTNIHAPGGIRTHDLSRRVAANLRHRPRGHCDRRIANLVYEYIPTARRNTVRSKKRWKDTNIPCRQNENEMVYTKFVLTASTVGSSVDTSALN